MKINIQLTNGSEMRAELYPDIAPITVANFVKLINEKFFDGLIFHRVIDGFMIQGGGMDENLQEKRAANIKGEFVANGVDNPISHTKGVLSMARAMDMDSASSQFFICVANAQYLDGNYAGFGKLCDEESEKVAVNISKVDTKSVRYYDNVPKQPIVIKTILIEE